ncbi:integrase [Pseudomonas lundensis]|uniref:integrase n=1 Tax=Pseudomonas lundensis TaxID=86185 RepID=UPI0014755A9E|nr:integrase [Pseudomonas lundensis]NNA26927.1 integrase [Pseudomonas lundensis]
MSNIFLFTPKAQVTSKQNLEDFVRLCRYQLTVFGANLDWYAHAWPGVGNFTRKGAPARGYKPEQLLDSGIMSFAKAYVRYQQGHNPTKLKNEFKAIRCIEEALITVYGTADITLTDLSVMDEAGRVADTYEATAYQAGISLVKLVEFLNESGIIAAPLVWKSPFQKPKEIHTTDAAGKEKREKKLPAVARLEAMGEMFANDLLDPRDRFTASIFALCMCAPSRISEVEDLPLNCLHWGTDSDGVERLGLRFYAGKGYESDIKWLSSGFVQIAEEAVRRLTELSAPGRALAAWLEDHPDKFYRHEDCPDVGEDQPLTTEQACQALGLSTNKPFRMLKHAMKYFEPFEAYYAKHGHVTLRFLNDYLHSRLPKGWPWLNEERHIKYREALCCFRQNELRSDFPARPVIVWAPGKSTFQTDINYIPGQEKSIWERYGYRDPDGSPISMQSHQIRHYLNTKANLGDLGQLYIAKWSGRKNIHQNSTYNHMTDDEHVERAREMGIGTALGKVRQNLPVTLADLEAVGEGIAHVTIFGYCVQDFAMLPCQKHRDCLNCGEHACIKGEAEKYGGLKEHAEGIRLQLAKAQAANEEGIYGADRWSQHQIKTLEVADQLVEILGSKDIPDGTIVRLKSDREFSPLKRAIAARSTTPSLPAPASKEPDMDELRALLGA